MPAPPNPDALFSPILVGCALETEVRMLRDRLGDSGCDWICTGLGAEKTRISLNRRFAANKPGFFIFTGAAGALSDRLAVGDVVFPEIWRLEDGQETACHPQSLRLLRRLGLKVGGVGLTLREATASADARRRLHNAFEAIVCDMESAAALKSAACFSVPAVAFKVVSDTVEEQLSIKEFKRRLAGICKPLARNLDTVLSGCRETAPWDPDPAVGARNQ